MTISEKALRLLDSIENIEMKSLEWGFTDGSLSENEALELANVINGEGEEDGDDLIEELINAKLVFELRNSSADVKIRSRFAEFMRLAASARQLFPNKPWQGAPHLVADFRIDRRSRKFPMRDLLPANILASNDAVLGKTTLRKALWGSLTNKPGLKLAGFQQRAVVRLVEGFDDSGTIITAGTGSGKTMAFYLPVLIRIGEAISNENWVKAIAIYPRVELLKDQFGEAYRMARAMDKSLAEHGKRPIRIGAFFRATPRNANAKDIVDHGWSHKGPNFVCPWLRCPVCNGELIWRAADVATHKEVLYCARDDCSGVVPDTHIVLTRSRLRKEPPDILFTTTEILNQRLSDQWNRGLFGVGVPFGKKPLFALLDEVHTYEGVTGAQAALTLRRWRHLLSAPIRWVGLSATLGDATRFFADLTGANQGLVVEIAPTASEFEEQSAEYQIVLRGDPSSRASLLSTTIQTSMLLPRLLDPPGAPVSQGSFGRRAFLFTDDLDVTNRLYDDLRDAEAYTIFGKPDRLRNPLAYLRGPGPDAAIRDLEGQRWRVCEEIGHPLDRRLVIGRTTSQDAGVNQSSNIIVATAALEVGFNDPEVGAVIQHKAPRGMASFLQRKGRAGRDRAMRPIMITVLSDYGRDRVTYQAYEHLFDPTFATQHLPIRNPYVLRIQAVYALIDWLAAGTLGYEKAWFWDLLSRPLPPEHSAQKLIDPTKALLTKLVQGDSPTVESLRNHIVNALGVDEETATSLLWEAPRSLLLEVVPTLVRRFFRQWKLAFPGVHGDRDLQVDFHPMPDFMPRSLFSDLTLPEVRIIIPPATINHDERVESMPILQALNQLVPGRVSRRFAFERGALSHWVPVDPSIPEQERRISDYAEEHEFIGSFPSTCNDHDDVEPLLVFRPWTVRLQKTLREVALPSSNARLSWRTDIEANGEPLTVPIPPRTQWRSYVKAACFHLHRFRGSLSVRRFAPTADAHIRTLKDDFSVTLKFRSDDNQPAAVGFELEVDGFYLDLELPNAEALAKINLPREFASSSRLAYLRDVFQSDPQLPKDLNVFQREWLFQILQSALLVDATSRGRTIAESSSEVLSEENLEKSFHAVMQDLFGSIPPAIDDSDEADDGSLDETASSPESAAASSTIAPSRLQQALSFHLSTPIVRDRLRALAVEFSNTDSERYGWWLRRTTVETLGEALLQACASAAPRHAAIDTLSVDVRDDDGARYARIWISEATMGGAGVLQAFAERFAAEPRVFFDALEAALAPTDIELVDGGLRQILEMAVSDPQISEKIMRLRATNSHKERAVLWESLSNMLSNRGSIDLSHALAVSFNNRLLRSGSGPLLDKLLLKLHREWDRLEEIFHIAIGLREFAYICSKDQSISSDVRSFLSQTLPASAAGQVSVLSAVANLLWPREAELRQKVLHSYNPYRRPRATDPALIRHLLLTKSITTVDLLDPAWRQKFNTALEARGICRLSCLASSTHSLRVAIVQLCATPVDVGYLQFFPAVERVERVEGQIVATLSLREQV